MSYNCRRIFFFILSFFVGYILSFGLVRLRTIRLSARLGAHIECRCSRSRGEDVTITDLIIKNLDRKCNRGCEWRHARKRWAKDFGWFLKKAVSWDLNRDEASWFSSLGEARPVGSTRCAARCWVIWNSQHSRNCASLSSCWKPNCQEGNKGFVPEQPRVVSVSSVSGFLYVWTFRMFHISVYLFSCIMAIQHRGSFVFTHLNGYKHCYLTQTIY